MAKFSDVAEGRVSEARAVLVQNSGVEIPIIVRALDTLQTRGIRERARKTAKERGVEDPKDGDPIYDQSVMVETIALACLDVDSSPEARTSFFASVVEAESLRPEQVAHIYEQWARHQEDVSPQFRNMSPADFAAGLLKLGGEDDGEAAVFFSRCGPALQWSYARSLAVQACAPQTPK